MGRSYSTTVRSSARKSTRREELVDTVRRVEKQRMKKQEELERLLEKERKRRRMIDEKYFALVKKIEADGGMKDDSSAHARPKRVQTRFKLGHKVIVRHPHNQKSIKRTARMTSASPTMFGTKSTRKQYLKADKDKRSLPAKLKKWPHY